MAETTPGIPVMPGQMVLPYMPVPPNQPAPAPAAPPQDPGLTELDKKILAFESQSWVHSGTKAQQIFEQFGLTEMRYFQLLNALLNKPAADAEDPTLVRRLRRLRQRRLAWA